MQEPQESFPVFYKALFEAEETVLVSINGEMWSATTTPYFALQGLAHPASISHERCLYQDSLSSYWYRKEAEEEYLLMAHTKSFYATVDYHNIISVYRWSEEDKLFQFMIQGTETVTAIALLCLRASIEVLVWLDVTGHFYCMALGDTLPEIQSIELPSEFAFMAQMHTSPCSSNIVVTAGPLFIVISIEDSLNFNGPFLCVPKCDMDSELFSLETSSRSSKINLPNNQEISDLYFFVSTRGKVYCLITNARLGCICSKKLFESSSSCYNFDIILVSLKENMCSLLLLTSAGIYECTWSPEETFQAKHVTSSTTLWVNSISDDREGNLYACYASNENCQVGLFREDIPILREYRSDPLFRAATGIWLLTRYSVDHFPSIAVISFVSSTILLHIKEEEGVFVERSELFGLKVNEKTIAIANSWAGSFLIQVCPQTIVVCRSNVSEEFADEEMTEFNLSPEESIKEAVISRDHIFALDLVKSTLTLFRCRIGRGSSKIIKISSLDVPRQTLHLTVLPLNEDPEKHASQALPRNLASQIVLKFLLALANSTSVRFWLITISENSADVEELGSLIFIETSSLINDLRLLCHGEEYLLLCGLCNGFCEIYKLLNIREKRPSTKFIARVQTGQRPVRFVKDWQGTCDYNLVLSGQVYNLKIEGDSVQVESLRVRADFLVFWNNKENNKNAWTLSYRFLAIEHEALLMFTSSIKGAARIHPFVLHKECRLIYSVPQTNIIYSIGTPITHGHVKNHENISANNQEILAFLAYFPAGKEFEVDLLSRMALSPEEIITSITAIDEEHIVVGMCVKEVGQIRVFRCQPNANKRRQSLPLSPTLSKMSNAASNQLISTCHVAFPHPVQAICTSKRGSGLLLVAAGPELHLLKVNKTNATFIQTEAWRSKVVAMVGNDDNLIAIASQLGGLQLFKIKEQTNLIKVWGSAQPDLIDSMCWFNEHILTAADRRGMIHWLQVNNDTMEVQRTMAKLANDIPIAIGINHKEPSLIAYGVSGRCYKFLSPFRV